MKIVKTVFIFALFVGLDACVTEPSFPSVPEIHFQSIEYYGYSDPGLDTMKITVTFKDGDGDLGFDQESDVYNSDPYNQRTYYIGNSATGKISPIQTIQTTLTTSNGNVPLIILDIPAELTCSTCKLVTWKTFNTAPFDTVKLKPKSSDITDCFPYQNQNIRLNLDDMTVATGISGFKNGIPNKAHIVDTIQISSESVVNIQDTLFYQLNPNFYNFDVEFLDASTDKLIDWWSEAGCDKLPSGRFGNIPSANGGPIEGTLLYNINTSGLSEIIDTRSIRIRVRVRDRALHVSNTITTLSGKTLADYKKN